MAYEKAKEAIGRVVDPFFKQGEPHLFIGLCCNRVYVGVDPAKTCRTCTNIPANLKVSSMKDLDAPSEELEQLLAAVDQECHFDPPK